MHDYNLQCFDTAGCTARRADVVMCLSQGADLHMAQLMPLPLTVSCSGKSRLVLPSWCRLTRAVPDKIQEGRKTVVFVPVSIWMTILS